MPDQLGRIYCEHILKDCQPVAGHPVSNRMVCTNVAGRIDGRDDALFL